MILFKMWIDDVYQGDCTTECTADESSACNCVCHARFHGIRTSTAIYTLLSSPDSLVTALAISHPGKAVKIEIDYPALLDHLRADAQIVTLTRIRGVYRP